MSRIALLILPFALAAPAFSQVVVPQPLPAPPPPTVEAAIAIMRQAGTPRIDIRQLGAVPGAPSRTATRKALQAALDGLAAGMAARSLPPGEPTVYVPPGSWQLDRWVSVPASGLRIVGDGPSSSITASGVSPLIVGMPFRPTKNNRVLDPSHYFKLDDLLDGSVKGKLGYRTGDNHATAWDSPMDLGPLKGWGEVKCLTVEFVLDCDQVPIGKAHVAGMSRKPIAGPWLAISSGTAMSLLYTLEGEATSRRLSVPFSEKPGRRRFAFQVDLDRGTASAWLDGLRVATTGDPPPPAGSRLADNVELPFHLGGSGEQGTQRSDYFQADPKPDLALCGLSIATAAKYKPDTPVGKPIERLDGVAVTDANSYFQVDGSTLGVLWITGDPADLASTRTVPFVTAGYGGAAAFAMDADHASNWSSIGDTRISGLSLHAGTSGSGLTIGAALGTVLTDVTADGARGMGSPSGPVSYTTRANDCTFAGTVGAIRLSGSTSIFNAPRVPRVGRAGVLTATGSNVTIRDGGVLPCFYAPGCVPKTYFRAMGGSLTIENTGIDNEENISPVVATVHVTATSGDATGAPSHLKLERVGSGTHRGMSFVRLDRANANVPPAAARVIDPIAGVCDAVIDFDGRAWDATLDAPSKPASVLGVADTSPAGPPVLPPHSSGDAGASR